VVFELFFGWRSCGANIPHNLGQMLKQSKAKQKQNNTGVRRIVTIDLYTSIYMYTDIYIQIDIHIFTHKYIGKRQKEEGERITYRNDKHTNIPGHNEKNAVAQNKHTHVND